jgi:bifunctional UDP-N-acetylglucosamine pyrophosphorylase/glucosamine-1-phosphate N-acetyltransferase
MKPVAVVVLAAGAGKRMRSALPKVLHPLGGRPLLSYPLAAARALGPAKTVVVVGHGAERVRQAFAEEPVAWAIQAAPLGSGDAVRAAAGALAGFSGDVLILSGDVPFVSADTLQRLLDHHRQCAARLTLLTMALEDPGGYGRVVRDADGRIRRVVEERDASLEERRIREVNAGVYAVEPGFLFSALERIDNDNDQREYYLPDIVALAADDGERVAALPLADPLEARGINTREELAFMERKLREAINRRWMAAGVTLLDPETTYIEPEVAIGSDTVIGPNTHLKGRTVVGSGCVIDGTAYITDARIGDRARVRFAVVLDGCELKEEVEVGPFARIRPGTVLQREVHIGNFVEVKNSTIGERTKAMHLAYIGDASIGRDTNIGAGTITCNYDGFAKHRTTIGDRVQVGSDTQLVAPVVVGDDAYIGAGSTITQEVPPGSLALSRTPQRNLPGWVEKFRARRKKASGEP